MSMFFDSPIDYCPVAKKYVLLDQTQKDCVREEGCRGAGCPLAKWFNRSSEQRSTGAVTNRSIRKPR
ncbi:MAG TPA: hypothetical protein VIT83_00665 [Gammaproteobacteria bacterium]